MSPVSVRIDMWAADERLKRIERIEDEQRRQGAKIQNLEDAMSKNTGPKAGYATSAGSDAPVFVGRKAADLLDNMTPGVVNLPDLIDGIDKRLDKLEKLLSWNDVIDAETAEGIEDAQKRQAEEIRQLKADLARIIDAARQHPTTETAATLGQIGGGAPLTGHDE